MSMFGNNIWATGEMNASNFALNGEVNEARKANRSTGKTTTDAMIGAPLANFSPSYPSVNLGVSYMDTSHTHKALGALIPIGIGSIIYTSTGVKNSPLATFALMSASVLSIIPTTKAIAKNRTVNE